MNNDDTLIRSPAETTTPSLPGISLGAVLGRGGMATVCAGLDQGFSPPRRVAVKLMNTAISADPDFRARFEHEASLVADFRHDNIVRVYASGETGGTKYIVMEYLPGGTLAERLERDGPLLADEVVRIAAQLADALSYAHDRGVVHRDFKPGNVLFTAEGKPVLSDFGVAKSVKSAEAQLTRHASVIGAPRYMAPEQERGESVSDRADVYSLGLTLYEMLTGTQPSSRERVLQTPEAGIDIRQKLTSLSPAAAELICHCLLFDPERRPSASQCARELLASSAETMARQGVRKAGGSARRNHAVIGTIAAVALAIFAGAVLYAFRQQSVPEPATAVTPAATAALPAPASPAPAPPDAGPVEATPPDTASANSHGDEAVARACGAGDPDELLKSAVNAGLRAKVQLTLAADPTAQQEATATLQHQVECLGALARAGFKSNAAERLQQDARSLLPPPG